MKRTLFDAEHEDYRRSVRAFLERAGRAELRRVGARRHRAARAVHPGRPSSGAVRSRVPEEYGGAGVHDFRYNALRRGGRALGVMPAVAGAAAAGGHRAALPPRADERGAEGALAAGDRVRRAIIGDRDDRAWHRVGPVGHPAPRPSATATTTCVDGAKTFITNGINADLVITAVRTGERPAPGLRCSSSSATRPGSSAAASSRRSAMHAQDTAELFFDRARVPVANLLGEEGDGFFGLTRNLAAGAPLDRRHGRRRRPGRPSTGRSTTSASARRSANRSAPCRTPRFRAGRADDRDRHHAGLSSTAASWRSTRGDLTAVDAAKAKWWATELQGRVVDGCLQLHGGYGYMLEYPIARAYAGRASPRIYGGTTEIMKEIIGRSLKLG